MINDFFTEIKSDIHFNIVRLFALEVEAPCEANKSEFRRPATQGGQLSIIEYYDLGLTIVP